MAIPNQGQFDSVLGYSLKRDYSGDALNWRNIETFNLEVIITDLANSNNIHAGTGKNFLSTYILDQVANKLKVDKNNTSIKSIEVPASAEALTENQIQAGKYIVTAEVKSKIDDATLLAQHPELNEATGAESGKFYVVKDAIHQYTSEIVSINETFDFQDKENGGGEFSHNVDVTLKRPDHCKQCEDNAWQTAVDANNNGFANEAACRTYFACPASKGTSSTKTIATAIANTLFSHDFQNTYFGHNAFDGALQNFGLTGVTANKHYFTETYDNVKNTFSFSKKMAILSEAASQQGVTIDAKFSIDFGRDGRVTVSQTLDLKSRNGNWSQLEAAVLAEKNSAYSNCSAHLGYYNKEIAGRGSTNSVAATLATTPITQTIIWDKHGLKATLTSQFSNDIQVSPLSLIMGQGAQFLETVDLSKDQRGVVTATYNITLTSHAPKSNLASGDDWTLAFCNPLGKCMLSDGTRNHACTTQDDCENVCGLCSVVGTGPGQSQQACEAATDANGNPGVWTPGVWTGWDTEALCEDDGGTWIYGKAPVDILRDYEATAETKVRDAIAYGRNPQGNADLSVEGAFWNTLDNWIYRIGDLAHPDVRGTNIGVTVGNLVRCTNTQVSVPTHGKAYTLTKTFTNDRTVVEHVWNLAPNGDRQTPLREYCPDCFNKVETKFNDVWPKRVVNEHVIIDRGDGFLAGTAKEGTSVISDAYFTQPGKRTATVTAVRKRNIDSNYITNPTVPAQELKALAYHLKAVLMEVFMHPKVSNSWQYVYYLSNLNYTYDSDYTITMTAELTYTYKKPKPQ